MGSLRKKLGKIKRRFEAQLGRRTAIRPEEIAGTGTSGRGAVVYIGNGAAGSSYSSYFEENRLRGNVYSGLGGSCNECAVQYPDSGALDKISVRNCFYHPEEGAEFAGFVLRRKSAEGTWLWYMEDGSWSPLESGEFRAKRFFDGDSLPAGDPRQVCILEAHWQSPEGRSLDCGYRMFRHRIAAHALGGYKGRCYLNSKTGFLYNLNEKGQKLFEADITLSEDGRLFVLHGYRQKDYDRYGLEYGPQYEHMNYEKTKALDIYGDHPMDVREFCELVKTLPDDVSFEIDIQDVTPELAREKIKHFVADLQGDAGLLKRMLVQVYSRKVYRAVDSEYHFESYMYNVRRHIDKLDEIITYCLDNGICSLSMRAAETTPEIVQKIKNSGLFLLGYTISSDVPYAATVLDYGVDSICSDFITEEDLDSCSARLGSYPFHLVCTDGDEEKRLPEMVENDGTFEVPECAGGGHADPGSTDAGPAGWKCGVIRDGKQLFYCNDGRYRLDLRDDERAFHKKITVFRPGEKLPVLLVREDDTVYLAAARGAAAADV